MFILLCFPHVSLTVQVGLEAMEVRCFPEGDIPKNCHGQEKCLSFDIFLSCVP